jgi:hypothetical protein
LCRIVSTLAQNTQSKLASLTSVLFQILLYLEGGHAARSGRCDGLAVATVLNVATGEDSGDLLAVQRGEDVVLGQDVAVFVEVEQPLERGGVGGVADAEEHCRDGQNGLCAG